MTTFETALVSRKQWLLSELQSLGLRIVDRSGLVVESPRRRWPFRSQGHLCDGHDHHGADPHQARSSFALHRHAARSAMGAPVLSRDDETEVPIIFPPSAALLLDVTRRTTFRIGSWPNCTRTMSWPPPCCRPACAMATLDTKCQFCAIGESLKGNRTIARKTPEQLTEVSLRPPSTTMALSKSCSPPEHHRQRIAVPAILC